MASRPPCVRADGVSKHYPNRVALDRTSFSLEEGGILGVVGPNGAGKTTLLKLIAGLIKPSLGRLSVLGHDTVEETLEVREVVGFLPEDDALYEDMNVRDYLLYFADLFTLKRGLAEGRIREALERFSLNPKATIGGLSKGMKRRVSIARSLLHDPQLLVYDEPTAGLDIFSRKDIDAVLMRLRGKGKSIIVSSHDLSHLEELCERVIVLMDGRIVVDSRIEDLQEHQPAGGYLIHFLAPDGGDVAPEGLKLVRRRGRLCSTLVMSEVEVGEVAEHIRSLGGKLLGITSNRGSLEDIVMQKAKEYGR